MKLAIIADDLTGANDSGVQLAKYGLKTSVLFGQDEEAVQQSEVVIFDTDSRSINKEDAYKRTFEVSQLLKSQGITNIFKKIDSTMRGNIGAEVEAIYDSVQPDFVFIAPGYPKNGRKVVNGYHYLNDVLLHETEIANDPKTPVTESHIPTLLQNQTNKQIGLIDKEILTSGLEAIQNALRQYAEQQIAYIVVDSEKEEDLELILSYTKQLTYNITWVGSAGIANYLPAYFDLDNKEQAFSISKQEKPVLTVVGSVNINSRKQLKRVLQKDGVFSIKADSYKAVSDETIRTAEIERVIKEAKEAAQKGFDVIVYSSGEQEDVNQAREVGSRNGFDFTETSNEIVKMLGEMVAQLMEENLFCGIVMTGGDTAKQVCELWGVKGFYLHDELEIGVPISKFIGHDNMYVITKAGGFGKETVFVHAIDKLKGVLN
ncbi:four-carbon acid sugar kinase family protein [Sutcliffiella cohnii]|uniref:four-carbon acid sugar kinase family protein n=1 Tax=Sutcliffiella cohnii TaxID=33932 RepID=UPI002E1A9469|nr:four-carbon acid sugar kinase family protein [Sutcliffiella cohnii]